MTAARLLSESLAAAMRICDQHGDDTAAREAMQQDVMATPHHLMLDLLEHLTAQTGKGNA